MTCYHCRERLLRNEPCKLMRQQLAKRMDRWGEIPEWKTEPHCGCEYKCKRKTQQKAQT